MKKATLGQVRAKLGEYVRTSATQPVVILRDGEPVAQLVGLPKKRMPAKLRDILTRAWKDYEEHGGISHDRFWEELAKESV